MTYFSDFARLGDLELSTRLGHITEEEKTLLEYYRAAESGTAAMFLNLVKSMPRVFSKD